MSWYAGTGNVLWPDLQKVIATVQFYFYCDNMVKFITVYFIV